MAACQNYYYSANVSILIKQIRVECYKLDSKNPNVKPGSMTYPFSIHLQLNQPGSATHPDLKVKSYDPFYNIHVQHPIKTTKKLILSHCG